MQPGAFGAVLAQYHRGAVAPQLREHLGQHAVRALVEARERLVAGGSLHALEPARPVARVVLGGADAGTWRERPDVLAVVETGGQLELTVPEERCDELLLLALRTGCSVRQVERQGPPR
ncbi:hypothetical protein [Prauserella flavalba]|uniref:Uncharacterized protein n=1 Tax=Prauserella flavalba TaxID=1477506 RepID=A0A318MHC5_9PSEU|nr:hypothetical protein [Prauserella flavalba]PXY38570.1 hypothetical protein BA062_02200 [Prauserella flavalba]